MTSKLDVELAESLLKTMIEVSVAPETIIIALHNVLCHGLILQRVFDISFDDEQEQKDLEIVIDSLDNCFSALERLNT